LSDSKKNNFDKNAICNAFWNYITITWDGKVLICCLDWDAKYIVGDVNKNSIEQIWNNKKYRSFRRMVLNGKVKDIPLCKRCDLLEHENIYADFLKFSFVNSFCRWKNDQ
jgi:radical SAM protein with 4Fe4S-binding SPASM domain